MGDVIMKDLTLSLCRFSLTLSLFLSLFTLPRDRASHYVATIGTGWNCAHIATAVSIVHEKDGCRTVRIGVGRTQRLRVLPCVLVEWVGDSGVGCGATLTECQSYRRLRSLCVPTELAFAIAIATNIRN